MEITKGQIFNLWNTNGRRRDILNALQIYLKILHELKEEYPNEQWNHYPESIAEFLFYQRAIDSSQDVFKKHEKYDAFMGRLGRAYESFLARNPKWIEEKFSAEDRTILDEAIEARARHYTSNLVKIGFADQNRSISDVGLAFLKKHVDRDSLEAMIPLDDINLILLRQMLKFKVFSVANESGERYFYAPFSMAIYLLLHNDAIDKNSFATIIQGLDPYLTEEQKNFVLSNPTHFSEIEKLVWNFEVEPVTAFLSDEILQYDVFSKYIKNQKSGSVRTLYYNFYRCLLRLRTNATEENYDALKRLLANNKEKLQKAFGYGKTIFDMGKNGCYTLQEFLEKNAAHSFLASAHFNKAFYEAFIKSSRVDDIDEYSDTTVRLLGATGLFQFSSLPELAYKNVMSLIFDRDLLKNSIFGVLTDAEYQAYEDTANCVFRNNLTVTEILNYNKQQEEAIIKKIGWRLGVSGVTAIHSMLKFQKSLDFANHIAIKYPKPKIMKLLPLFSDRKNDSKIKKEVNDTASVPTIYEYVIGIAWYYISDQSFDLFDSLRLTLNADFEPVLHAGGGDGDIVIHYADIIVMLEVTMMKKDAQRRNEWEPVLRHSLNLKAAEEPKETITFFIADQLDYNTVSIWRAVAAVSLESTNTHKVVDGVIIMPFTNKTILEFLEKNIRHTTILQHVQESFKKIPKLKDVSWHEDILDAIFH
ncbi:MAG: AlwI family type II restriction endonuclease [Clostridia bacterium]